MAAPPPANYFIPQGFWAFIRNALVIGYNSFNFLANRYALPLLLASVVGAFSAFSVLTRGGLWPIAALVAVILVVFLVEGSRQMLKQAREQMVGLNAWYMVAMNAQAARLRELEGALEDKRNYEELELGIAAFLDEANELRTILLQTDEHADPHALESLAGRMDGFRQKVENYLRYHVPGYLPVFRKDAGGLPTAYEGHGPEWQRWMRWIEARIERLDEIRKELRH